MVRVEVRPKKTAVTPVDDENADESMRRASFRKESRSMFDFRRVSFSVKRGRHKQPLQILHNLQATVESGRVLAILGPSGAGKTTLLNVITLQGFGGQPTGSITLNGHELTLRMFIKRCAIVTQQDFHWTFLTCRETITFAAALYQQRSASEQHAQVDEMLDQMGLAACADTRVGNQFVRGLSGGQKRRLSIAIALLKSPTVMFMDEPTSGLDAAAAASIMSFVKRLSLNANIATVCTIHQPSAAVFQGFDQVMVLSRGRCAYRGPADRSVAYFGGIGHQMPEHTNPAEFMLNLVSSDFNDAAKVSAILEAWESQDDLTGERRESCLPAGNLLPGEEAFGAGFGHQLYTLLRRHSVLTLRDPSLYVGRMVMFLLSCCFFALVYIDARERTNASILKRFFLIMWVVACPTILGVVAVYVFNEECKAIRKEALNGMVSPSAYLLTRTIIELPLMVLLSFCAVGASLYGMLDWYTPHMLPVVLMYACVFWSFDAMAQLVAVQFHNPLLGMLEYMMLWFASFLFAGVIVDREAVIWPLRLFSYLSPLYYAMQGITYLEFSELNYAGAAPCNPSIDSECTTYHDPTVGFKCNASIELVCYGFTGKQVLDGLGVSYKSISSKNTLGDNFLYILIFCVACKMLYYTIVLARMDRVKKVNDNLEIPRVIAPAGPEKHTPAIVYISPKKEAKSADEAKPSAVLHFRRVSFSVKRGRHKQPLQILHNLQATVESGRVLAILGPSGAGKTTLLNVITLQGFGGQPTGSITLNGHELTLRMFIKRCAIVTQQDFHWTFLTCRETITFAAALYQQRSASEQHAQVDEMLDQMGLAACADTRVGNQFVRGLSGGQKRRLSIAIALLKSPTVMFMDEPTSGLDAAAAASIMSFVKRLSLNANIATVCTIHQPSAAVFQGFDQVMVLSRGRCAYRGPADRSVAYFGGIGHQMPEHTNPAEFMLNLVSSDFNDAAKVSAILEAWESQDDLTGERRESCLPAGNLLPGEEAFGAGFGHQLYTLLRRHSVLTLRDPSLYVGRMVMFLLSCCFFALVYIDARERTNASILKRFFLIMWVVACPTILGVVAVYVFNEECKAIRKEALNGMVSPSAYLLTRTIIELPLMVLLSFCAVGASLYGIADFNVDQMANVVFFNACLLWSFEAMAQCFSALFENPLVGMLMFVSMWFGSFLFADFLVPRDQIVWPFRAFCYVFPFKPALRGTTWAEFHELTLSDSEPCAPGDSGCMFHPSKPELGRWRCPNITAMSCFGHTGDQALESIGTSYRVVTSESDSRQNVLEVLAFGLFFKLWFVALIICKARKSVKLRKHERRPA
eukprot:g1639.t1